MKLRIKLIPSLLNGKEEIAAIAKIVVYNRLSNKRTKIFSLNLIQKCSRKNKSIALKQNA